MHSDRFRLIVLVAFAPALASAASPYPPGVVARGVALNAACQAAGGQAANGAKPFLVIDKDLTGDGRTEFILDESAFGCSSASFKPGDATGAPIEVFDGATGLSLYRGTAWAWQVLAGAKPQVMLTLRGNVCSPNATATTTCQRPLVWNAATKTLSGPQGPLNRPAGSAMAPAPAAPAVAAPLTAAGRLTLTDADKDAAFRAAGFKKVGAAWKNCVEETPTLSYQAGAIEEVLDLNADGRPEAVITEISGFCHGGEGDAFFVVSKDANGAWRKVADEDGIFMALPSKANGWQEIMVGGPGFTHPVLRYNGKEFVQNRMQRE